MWYEVDGNRVFASHGSGSAMERPILFVHGAGMDHSIWVMPARHFARHGRRVLAVDLPGHGRSEGSAATRIEDYADWTARLLDAAGIEQATVVGHSMGSLIAFAFAARHRERCERIALLGTSVPMPVTERLLSAAQTNDHAAIDMANGWSHSPRGQLGGNDNPGHWMLTSGERLLERARPGVFHADLSACNAFDARDAVVSVPALIVIGDADQMTPAKAGLGVAARLPDPRIVRLPACGHSMLSERPNEVLDALRDFLR